MRCQTEDVRNWISGTTASAVPKIVGRMFASSQGANEAVQPLSAGAAPL